MSTSVWKIQSLYLSLSTFSQMSVMWLKVVWFTIFFSPIYFNISRVKCLVTFWEALMNSLWSERATESNFFQNLLLNNSNNDIGNNKNTNAKPLKCWEEIVGQIFCLRKISKYEIVPDVYCRHIRNIEILIKKTAWQVVCMEINIDEYCIM